jgi:hypothetical protein
VPSTRSTLDALLKDYYLPGVRKTLNDECFLLSQIEAKSDRVEGRQVIMSVRSGRHQGIGARGDGGTLPTAGQSTVINAKVALAYNYGRIQISGPLMRSITSDRGGFARPLETETKGVVTDLKKDINRQLFGDATGALATLTAATSAATTLTVSLSSTQLRQIVPGMVIDIYSGSTSQATSQTIASVTSTTITLGASVTAASGSKIYRAGSKDLEMDGLAKIISSSGTYLTIDPTTAAGSVWKSTVNANGGTARTAVEDLFFATWQSAHIASGDEIDLWVTTPGIHRSVATDLLSDRRFMPTNTLKGGYEGVDVSAAGQGRKGGNSVSLVYDQDAPIKQAWGICTQRLEFQRASDWDFMEEDGAVLSRVPNTDAYEATLFLYAQPCTDSRQSHARIDDLSDS